MQGVLQVNGVTQGCRTEEVGARTTDITHDSTLMTFEVAAGVPTVAQTAWRKFVVCANFAKGLNVLIHRGADSDQQWQDKHADLGFREYIDWSKS